MTRVLLTGGSGFIATHILDMLIEKGYDVVTTVRTQEKADMISAVYPDAKLKVCVVPDIAQANAFDEVVRDDCLDVVLHNAKTELLDPSIEGTVSILKAVKQFAPTVKRVVVTSSFVAMLSAGALQDPAKVFDESDWNPATYEDGLRAGESNKALAYRAAKTLAERAAWRFVDEEQPLGFDLVTICPPLVFGPVLRRLASLSAVNTSNVRFVELLQGHWRDRIGPSLGVNLFVDVRDAARAHVAALENPAAGGCRFFCVSGAFCDRDIAAAARRHISGPLGDLLPPEDVEGGGYPSLIPRFDNSRATEVLGIDWIGIEKCTVDTIESLMTTGA